MSLGRQILPSVPSCAHPVSPGAQDADAVSAGSWRFHSRRPWAHRGVSSEGLGQIVSPQIILAGRGQSSGTHPASKPCAQSSPRCSPGTWADKLWLVLRTEPGWAAVPFAPRSTPGTGVPFMLDSGALHPPEMVTCGRTRALLSAACSASSLQIQRLCFLIYFCKRLVRGHTAETGEAQGRENPPRLVPSSQFAAGAAAAAAPRG